MREIVNVLLYQSRTGCQWDYLPHVLPPSGAVKHHFYKWRDDGTDQAIDDLLRWQVREKKGRSADPSPVVLDSQSLHAAAGVPAKTTRRDAVKKVPGRKRCLAIDVLGLVVAVVVPAASAHDNAVGTALPDRTRVLDQDPPRPPGRTVHFAVGAGGSEVVRDLLADGSDGEGLPGGGGGTDAGGRAVEAVEEPGGGEGPDVG
ncbi:transposase [Streptomyces sp. NPDC096132]|uniref:transposase n=1 Tax=Streptomyces sp. NPDC096132 TaxID=3366075 RepID=UPI003810F37D